MIFSIKMPVFPVRLWFYSGDDWEKFAKKTKPAVPKSQITGLVIYPCIWIDDVENTGLLVHELHHFSDDAANWCEIRNKEFKAYLQEFLFNKIQSRIRKGNTK